MNVLPDTQLYIDGKLRPAAGGRMFDNLSPWTGEVIGRSADASPADVDAAIAAARRAFDTTDWSSNHEQRYELIRRLRDAFRANKDKLILIARHEIGAALGVVSRAQVDFAMMCFDGLLKLIPQITYERDMGVSELGGTFHKRVVVNEPAGVVGAITPWNVPLYINVEKVISALLAGCTVVLKPAPDTPAMGTIFGELAAQVGFPPGVLNVITSADPVAAGEKLVTDKRVDLITFTGSTGVGKQIMRLGADTLKRVFLELGGKSAKIVLEDAPDFAREVTSTMVVSHAGQGCAIQTRLLVPRSRYEEAKAILKSAYAAYDDKWGSFDDPTHVMGPVVSKKQMERVKSYVDLGVAEGATLLHGGRLRPDKGAGWFIEPTVFVDVTNDMRIAREEIFGPVLVVIPFEDEEDAIRIANDSDYGLSGGVASADTERAIRIARRIRTGTISVNGGMCIAADLPFGGYKNSGIGRAWGIEGIEEYFEKKALAWRVPGPQLEDIR
jgi:aldehyde dehydrogenase (NAD+)